MRKIAGLIILFSLVSCNEVMKYPHELEEKLAELDIVIERKEEIEAMKKAQLADLRKRASYVSTLEDRFTASEDLYNAYYKYNTDSALFYARQYHNTAMASGQTYHINRSAMFMADSYTMSGMYAEASEYLTVSIPHSYQPHPSYNTIIEKGYLTMGLRKTPTTRY